MTGSNSTSGNAAFIALMTTDGGRYSFSSSQLATTSGYQRERFLGFPLLARAPTSDCFPYLVGSPSRSAHHAAFFAGSVFTANAAAISCEVQEKRFLSDELPSRRRTAFSKACASGKSLAASSPAPSGPRMASYQLMKASGEQGKVSAGASAARWMTSCSSGVQLLSSMSLCCEATATLGPTG